VAAPSLPTVGTSADQLGHCTSGPEARGQEGAAHNFLLLSLPLPETQLPVRELSITAPSFPPRSPILERRPSEPSRLLGDFPYKQLRDNSELGVLTDPQQLASATAELVVLLPKSSQLD
jgi:hypothetical protein